MTDETAQLQRVKELINQQEYDQARNILVSLPNNPTAQKWLGQLNERFPKENPAEDEKLAQARRFIDAERYEQAMAILVTLPNNAVAQKWLERIKTLDRNDVPKGGTPMSDIFTPKSQPDGSTVPMLPPVIDATKMLLSRLGNLGGVMAVSALMFAIYYAVLYGVEIESDIARTLLDAVLMGVAFYGVVFALSLVFSTVPRNTYLFTVGLVAAVTLVSGLIDSNSYIIHWVFWLLFAVGIAYLFSRYNRFVPAGGEARLNRNQFILFSILLLGLFGTSMSYNMIYLFRSTLDLSNLLSGLFGGAIFGAVVGAAFTLTLEEAGN